MSPQLRKDAKTMISLMGVMISFVLNSSTSFSAAKTEAGMPCLSCGSGGSLLNLAKELVNIEIVGEDKRRPLSLEEHNYFSGIGIVVCRNDDISPLPVTSTAFLTKERLPDGTSSQGRRTSIGSVSHAFWNLKVGRRYNPISDCVFRLISVDGKTIIFESGLIDIRAGKQYDADAIEFQNDDWAAIRLATPAPSTVNYYDYAQLGNLKVGQRYKAKLASFQRLPPSGNLQKTTDDDGCEFWSEGADSADSKGSEIFHSCDALPGSSGGPIFYERANGERFIVGINSRDGVTRRGVNRAVQIGEAFYKAAQEISRDVVAAGN